MAAAAGFDLDVEFFGADDGGLDLGYGCWGYDYYGFWS